jgi:hypothetical protein
MDTRQPSATYVGLLFNWTTDILLCENIAQSKRTGSHCLCHARWFFRRRLASQLRGRPDRPQKDRYPFWGCMGDRVYIAMRRSRMHSTFLFPGILLIS